MIHPWCELAPVDPEVGLGLVARRRIPASTIVWLGDTCDEVLTEPHRDELSDEEREEWRAYGWVGPGGEVTLCADEARYVNHACTPNSVAFGNRTMVALRDIEAGEQLTEDYLFLNRRYDFECRCGSPRCRGAVEGHGGVRRQVVDWSERQLRATVRSILAVDQPLLTRASNPELRWIRAVARRQRRVVLDELLLPAPVDLDALLEPGAPLRAVASWALRGGLRASSATG